MFRLILLFFFQLAFVQFSAGQNKKDNTIIVNCFVSFNKLKETLLKEGFTSFNYDTVFVTAAGRPLGNSNALKQTYVIIRTDSSLSFTGFIVFGEDKNYSSGMLLENRYGYSKKGFFIMNKICASFGFPLVYTKEADF